MIFLLITDDARDIHGEDELKRQRNQYNGDQIYSNVIFFFEIWNSIDRRNFQYLFSLTNFKIKNKLVKFDEQIIREIYQLRNEQSAYYKLIQSCLSNICIECILLYT